MAPVSGSTSVEGPGPVLGTQVKTVEDGDDARLVIDRIDGTDLLRQTQATCLLGIGLSDESVSLSVCGSELHRSSCHIPGSRKIAAREREIVRIKGALQRAEELSEDVAAAIERAL
jgi:hypothetical protein